MEITPYKNGTHSLAEGLRQLNSFLNEGGDPFKMKEVVIKLHHGLETLFKDILFQNNPIFILDEKTTVKQALECYQGFFESKNNYLFDEAKTIAPTEAIKRLKSLHLGDTIPPKDFAQIIESFERLNSLRNQIQHFALKINPDEIVRILGNLIPKSIALLKACYFRDLTAPYLAKMQVVPHKPLPGMVKLFTNTISLDHDLNAIYPDSTKIIDALEARYDILLQEAIKLFSRATFAKQAQILKLSDHGRCGAPPYMPRLALKGWMNEEFESHKNAITEAHWFRSESIIATYSASLKVEQPVIKQIVSDGWHSDVISELSILCESKMNVLHPEGFFSIPGTEEHISFVKNPEITLNLQITCEVQGMFDDRHFDIRTVRSLSGSLHIKISSLIFGDTTEEPSIFGIQSILLNKENTAVRLSASVEGNRRLRDNHHLEINIEAAEDIAFK